MISIKSLPAQGDEKKSSNESQRNFSVQPRHLNSLLLIKNLVVFAISSLNAIFKKSLMYSSLFLSSEELSNLEISLSL